jgi:hypothetical protein
MRAFAHRPRGAAAVEFAIVLPLLLTILFGTIEWGYYFFTREIVINSAREGARVGTLQTMQSTDAINAAKNYLTGSGLVLNVDGTVGASVYANKPDGSSCPSESSCIRIEYVLPSLTGFLDAILGTSRTVKAYAEMRK